jgi:MFS family permease
VKEARDGRTRGIALALYTTAGLVSSSLVGLLLGSVGEISPSFGVAIPLGVAIVVTARELGLAPIPLVQWRRQTSEIWGKTLPRNLAATLWGFDLGLVFTTYLTFSGAWLVTSIALFAHDIGLAVLLFAAYWLGRAATVWLAALEMSRRRSTTLGLVDLVGRRRHTFQRIHAASAASAALTLVVAAATQVSL